MNTQDQESLENELKKLSPAKPSDLLAYRIQDTFDNEDPSEEPTFKWLPILLPIAIAASLGFAFGLTFLTPKEEPTQIAETSIETVETSRIHSFPKPESSNVFYRKLDDGIVYSSNEIPHKQFRYQYLDTLTWENTHTNTTVELYRPREEIIQVQLQHY